MLMDNGLARIPSLGVEGEDLVSLDFGMPVPLECDKAASLPTQAAIEDQDAAASTISSPLSASPCLEDGPQGSSRWSTSASGDSLAARCVSVYVDARDETASEPSTVDASEQHRASAGSFESDIVQPSRRYSELPPRLARRRSLGEQDGAAIGDQLLSLHPALGVIKVGSRRHSSAPHADEIENSPVPSRAAAVRLKPLVLTPARSISTPLTTSTREKRVGGPLSPVPSRRYSSPGSPLSTPEQRSGPEFGRPQSTRRRSIGYKAEPLGETDISPVNVKRLGSTSSESTAFSSDLSRRSSVETCDTQATTPSSSPEKLPFWAEKTRLPSLQNRFDPQRGLSLDVVLETEDDGVDIRSRASGSHARYRAFWEDEAARNESAFQDVCVALDELAPSFPTPTLFLDSATPSASPISRSASTTSDESGSPRTPRRGKPIVIKPSVDAPELDTRRQSRRISRIRQSKPAEAMDTSPKPHEVKQSAAPVSSVDVARGQSSAPQRVPRPLVWPPPNETKRLSLAPVLAYDSEDEDDSLASSLSDLDEKRASPSHRIAHLPRSARTRDQTDDDDPANILDFLLEEAPRVTEVRLSPPDAASRSKPTARPQPQPLPAPKSPSSPKSSRSFASRLLSSFSASSPSKGAESPASKAAKKRPTSLMSRSKSAAPASGGVRQRPVISGPLELEATEILRSDASGASSLRSVSTISLGQAQRTRSASFEVRRVPVSPTAVAAAVRESADEEGVAEELLVHCAEHAPAPQSTTYSASSPSVPSYALKKLPSTPLLLSPLWALPVTDLPRNPLAWAERSAEQPQLQRTASMSSIASAGPTAALIGSYA